MCGIVGYVGVSDGSKILIEGLKRLEYRGYDSAGIAMIGAEQNLENRALSGQDCRIGGKTQEVTRSPV